MPTTPLSLRIYVYWLEQPDGFGYFPCPVIAMTKNAVAAELFPFDKNWQDVEALVQIEGYTSRLKNWEPDEPGLWCLTGDLTENNGEDGGEEDEYPLVLNADWRRLTSTEMAALQAGTLGRTSAEEAEDEQSNEGTTRKELLDLLRRADLIIHHLLLIREGGTPVPSVEANIEPWIVESRPALEEATEEDFR